MHPSVSKLWEKFLGLPKRLFSFTNRVPFNLIYQCKIVFFYDRITFDIPNMNIEIRTLTMAGNSARFINDTSIITQTNKILIYIAINKNSIKKN